MKKIFFHISGNTRGPPWVVENLVFAIPKNCDAFGAEFYPEHDGNHDFFSPELSKVALDLFRQLVR